MHFILFYFNRLRVQFDSLKREEAEQTDLIEQLLNQK